MAERRMFAKTIVLSDAFLDMPMSARCLYFTLGMFADDDGFVNNPKAIMRQCGASLDDMNVLIGKKFVIVFEDGVIVIKHWRMNNYLRNDRYTETKYVEKKAMLTLDENGAYHLDDKVGIPGGIPMVDQRYTEDRLGKDSIGKVSIGKDRLGNNNMVIADDRLTSSDTSFDKEFDEIWELYPKKQGKQNALKAYIKARKDGVDKDDIINGINNYIFYIKKMNIEPKYIKQGSTWFNQRCWGDDYTVVEKRTMIDEILNAEPIDLNNPYKGTIWENV